MWACGGTYCALKQFMVPMWSEVVAGLFIQNPRNHHGESRQRSIWPHAPAGSPTGEENREDGRVPCCVIFPWT